jgi:hypothetical protein
MSAIVLELAKQKLPSDEEINAEMALEPYLTSIAHSVKMRGCMKDIPNK